METFHIQATQNLPEHSRIFQAVVRFFYEYPGVIGCFLGGSAAAADAAALAPLAERFALRGLEIAGGRPHSLG